MIASERPFQDRLAIVAVSALRIDVRLFSGARPLTHDLFIQSQKAADLSRIQFHERSGIPDFRTYARLAQISKQPADKREWMRRATWNVEINFQLFQILPGQVIRALEYSSADRTGTEKDH